MWTMLLNTSIFSYTKHYTKTYLLESFAKLIKQETNFFIYFNFENIWPSTEKYTKRISAISI